jgi:hypothetical protein
MIPLMQQAAREAAASSEPQLQAWARDLQNEVTLLQDDDQRVPFETGLPESAAGMMGPVEERLRQGYSVTVNPVELIFEESWERND